MTQPRPVQQITELQSAVAAQKAQLDAQQKLLERQAALIEQLSRQTAVATAPSAPAKKPDMPVVAMNQGRPTVASVSAYAAPARDGLARSR